MAGYEVNYRDFSYLLTYPHYRNAIAPLVEAWLNCEVIPIDDRFELKMPSGQVLDPKVAHEIIQGNPTWQFELYQSAMSLWR